MKVGILTFHNVANYGATLQTYALFHILTSNGYDVELIDYFPSRISRRLKAILRTIF